MLSTTHMLCHAHLGWYNQHSCIAEAYKTRGRGFQGRKLRHLVTSKAGCNQASGSFLSAGPCGRYTAGLYGGRPVSQNWWRKHYSGYFYTGFLLIKRQSGTFHWQQENGVIRKASLTGFMPGKIKKCRRFCHREIYFSPWPVSHSSIRNKGAVKTVIKLNWKHRYDFKKRYTVLYIWFALQRVFVWVCTCI